METSLIKRSIIVRSHKTSVSFEDPFWTAVKEITDFKGLTLRELVSQIDILRKHNNLSSAIRLFVLDHYASRAPTREAVGMEDEAELAIPG